MYALTLILLTSVNILALPGKHELNARTVGSLSGTGLGWDFMNEDVKYPAQAITFKDNKMTTDGKYLIPDCVVVENVKKTKYTDLADVMSSSSSYVSKTSKSVKISGSIGIGVVGIGGSYSKDNQEIVAENRNLSTVTTRTKYIDHRYTLLTNSRCPLDQKFKDAIADLVFGIEFDDADLTKYLAQTIIDDYGTHFVSKIHVGGIIYSDDYISAEYWDKMKGSSTTVQTAASISLASDKLSISASFDSTVSISNIQFNDYKNNVSKTQIDAVGGRYIIGMSVPTWAQTLEDNYVTIDREGSLISNLILPSNFPGFSGSTLLKANQYVQQAISEYLKTNTIDGCSDRNNINYNPQANYDSGNACTEKLKFGGFVSTFKKCSQYNGQGECTNFISLINEFNFLTKNMNCPNGYIAQTGTSNNPWLSLTQCVGDQTISNGGVLFGGIYSSLHDNPVTKSKKCPPGFVPQSLFDSNDNFICQSADFSVQNIRNAVPFGGFVANCLNGLTGNCPAGLSLKPINVLNGCEINYCTRIKDFSFPVLRRPPFVPKPPSARFLRFNPYTKRTSL